ncbi:MAG: glutathione S-transferase N-terminal domain-containing protein [Alphaproteobacteria bacterium]|nr:glutathione S-transferase N-terminal domain-containing protein [Alphaproteobacteria bacterium]
MKLFHCRGTCSLGILIILEELSIEFEVEIVDLKAGDQYKDKYLSSNPKGKVPALLLDNGTVLTEFQAIAMWLGRSFKNSNLLPHTLMEEIKVLECLDYLVGTIHMRGFTMIFMPHKFVKTNTGQIEIKDFGFKTLEASLKILSEMLGDNVYLFNEFSVADAAAFYILNWAVRLDLKLASNLQNYHNRLLGRKSIMKALRH